jgi:hypothetical protein
LEPLGAFTCLLTASLLFELGDCRAFIGPSSMSRNIWVKYGGGVG